MRLNSTKINITDYLEPKTITTARVYRSHLNKYFHLFYSDLEKEWETIGRNKAKRKNYARASTFKLKPIPPQ